ncbi:uncharacterized protein HMPREF1541_06442 [Cyphellophora europaea CBS 101466]|uniref:Alpha/beta hydrolase fold-3 domain-containing protein n=1 Tax=Cyphellophora europaea (strain CBS 101466) TaxID=1220924 RepID=W2RPM7_CYPE1|nr:uncharacterized protein HMPREF1541_06442 [Cyphellophora europaea CBS 101466]ETN38407.1 hypothetical protein HMPREF1541_06442 [Cyphellophora europaea CBS 101466]
MVLHDPNNLEDLSGYAAFDIHRAVFKTIHSHPIHLDVLIPKSLSPQPAGAPLILRFHGGGLITGSSLLPAFFPTYLLDLAIQYSAIIISPNHRLLPEVAVSDILADIDDCWCWLHTDFHNFLSSNIQSTIKADLSRIFTIGDSAGGYLALQTALSHPEGVRAACVSYPMVDIKDRWFMEHFHKQLFEIPQLGMEVVEERSAMIKKLSEDEPTKEKIVLSEDPKLSAIMLMFAFIQHGLYRDYFDMGDARQFPLERVQRGERFPKGGILVLHGIQDSVVPVEHSRTLERVVKQAGPQANFCLLEREGDHGFDTEVTFQEPWLLEALAPLVRAWLE